MQLGGRIREARIRQQMTQKEVVGEFMTRNMLSKIENGSATPSVKTLEYIAGALSLPVSYFLGESDAPNSKTPDEAEHLSEIIRLADQLVTLCSVGFESGGQDIAVTAALCAKARAMLAEGGADAAFELLKGRDGQHLSADAQRMLYRTLEACCKARDDYKLAYEYACKVRKDTEDAGHSTNL